MLLAPAQGRGPARPDQGDWARQACPAGLSALPRTRLQDAARRPALAPDRESARASTTGRAGCRRSRPPSRWACRSSGICSITAPRTTSTRVRRIFRNASRISHWPRWKSSSRSAAGRRWSVRSTRSISCRGRWTTAISRTSARSSAAGSSTSSSGPRSPRAKAIKHDWPKATIVWAEPLIHIAPRDHRRQTLRAAEQNLQGMYEAYDWIIGRAKPGARRRSVARRRRRLELLSAQPVVLQRPHDPDGAPRIPAAGGHAGGDGRALRQTRSSSPKQAPKVPASRRGSIMSAMRCATRSTAALTFAASVCTRSRPIRAGTTAATPSPVCCRRSPRTAPATSTNDCSRKSSGNGELFAGLARVSALAGRRLGDSRARLRLVGGCADVAASRPSTEMRSISRIRRLFSRPLAVDAAGSRRSRDTGSTPVRPCR